MTGRQQCEAVAEGPIERLAERKERNRSQRGISSKDRVDDDRSSDADRRRRSDHRLRPPGRRPDWRTAPTLLRWCARSCREGRPSSSLLVQPTAALPGKAMCGGRLHRLRSQIVTSAQRAAGLLTCAGGRSNEPRTTVASGQLRTHPGRLQATAGRATGIPLAALAVTSAEVDDPDTAMTTVPRACPAAT